VHILFGSLAHTCHFFKRLREMNYSGCITAEPHLLHSEQFHVSGRENYIEAVNRILQLLEEAGFAVQKS
jgi:hypothetical protein